MDFDPDLFLARYADAFNARDPEQLRAFFALDDDRFAVFEDFSEELFDGEGYAAVLEGAEGATGEMSFDLIRSFRFGDFAVLHAFQKIIDEHEEGSGQVHEARFRATMWVTLSAGSARIVVAHFSVVPPSGGLDGPPEGRG